MDDCCEEEKLEAAALPRGARRVTGKAKLAQARATFKDDPMWNQEPSRLFTSKAAKACVVNQTLQLSYGSIRG